MRKVLIYFQDDRARRHQQKGRPPCGHPRTTRTIRKGQRGRLPRARRGSRGQSRSYVVGRAQVRLAFSHLALPLPLFLSRFLQSCCYYYTLTSYILFSLCVPLLFLLLSLPRFSTPRTQTHAQNLTRISLEESSRSLSRDILHLRTRSNWNAQRKEEQVIEAWFASSTLLQRRMRCGVCVDDVYRERDMSRVDNEIVSKKNSRSKMRKREDSVERGF